MKKITIFVSYIICLFAFADDFTELKRQAEAGDSFAQYKVAKAYATGDGVAQNNALALKWLNLSIKNGSVDGENMLGVFYSNGLCGLEKDIEKSLSLLESAAEKGSLRAQENLAKCYLYGINTNQDFEKAFYYAEKAAVQNSAIGQGVLAYIYYTKGSIEKDLKKSLYFAQKSFQQNDPMGLHILGLLYMDGKVVEKDLKKAFELISMSAMQKEYHPLFYHNLAYLYLRGDGTEKNVDKAVELFTQAANMGYEDAEGVLAEIYLKKQNFSQAFYWAQKASANKDIRGDKILAEIYLFGRGAEKNPQKAFEFCKKAADKGDIEAISNLASMYLLGGGTEKNMKKAFELHLKAAESGIVNSQKILALFYCGKYGDAAEKDFAKAQYWAEKAAANGDFDAKMLLIVIRNKDNPGKVKSEMEKLKETQGKTFSPKQINFIDNFIKNVENSAKNKEN